MRRRLLRNPLIWVGGLVALLVIGTALAAPFIATHDPVKQSLTLRLKPPGFSGHWLGTDEFGRDIFSRIVYGARVSLQVGLISTGIGMLLGSLAGVLSGYFGGRTDMMTSRVMDVLMAFPSILLALAIMAVLGSSLTNVMIAIGITTVPRFQRVLRGSVIAIRQRDFVQASHALGAGNLRTIVRHVLPNVVSPVIVMTSTSIASAILVEASLSFLGLGVQPPTPTWGSIITDGKQHLETAPWIATFSGLVIMTAVLGFNLLGDGLRDMLDPKLKT